MFTLKTGTAAHEMTPEGFTALAVPFEITDESGAVVQAMKETFALTATAEEIKEVLQRHFAVFTEDSARYDAVKEHQGQLDSSAEAAKEISNITL